jgi:hypothetical protein
LLWKKYSNEALDMFFEILKDYQKRYPNREEFDCKYKKTKSMA